MNKKIVFLFGIFLILFSSFSVSSQSMSELDIKGFESQEDRVTSSAVKSPFSQTQPAMEDLVIEDLFLTGIAVGRYKSYALISGHILSEGDTIAGLKVRSITKDKVILQHLDKIHKLSLEGGL